MDKNEIKIGGRYYHICFGWCKVTHTVAPTNKVLVELEADEIEYYVIGQGRENYQRNKETGRHILYTPISDLIKEKRALTHDELLKKATLSPRIYKWDESGEPIEIIEP
jgi:hypothetical protein